MTNSIMPKITGKTNSLQQFNILDHLNNLEVIKETSSEYHCTCPVCSDSGFKIDKRSGKYNTFKCGCMETAEGKKAIIESLAPIDKNQKAIRPKQIRTWTYFSRDAQPLVRVSRQDDGDGSKPKRWQERWQTANSQQSTVKN